MRTVASAGFSRAGRGRPENQDRWSADDGSRFYVVADGMGGALEGARAAELVVSELPALIRRRVGRDEGLAAPGAEARLRAALRDLNGRMCEAGAGQPDQVRMGAAVVLAWLRGEHALVAHMGDGRAYLLREGYLERLTRDHSLVELLLDSGDVTAVEAPTHPARGRLTRYVGMSGEALPESSVLRLWPGDRLLLCSDGLCGAVADPEILAVLHRRHAPDEACRRLVDAAWVAGGRDDITALLIAVA